MLFSPYLVIGTAYIRRVPQLVPIIVVLRILTQSLVEFWLCILLVLS